MDEHTHESQPVEPAEPAEPAPGHVDPAADLDDSAREAERDVNDEANDAPKYDGGDVPPVSDSTSNVEPGSDPS